MRALLISANTEKIPDPVFPIGAAAVWRGRAASGPRGRDARSLLRRATRRSLVVDAIRDFSAAGGRAVAAQSRLLGVSRRTPPTSRTIARLSRWRADRRPMRRWCSAARASRSCRRRSSRSSTPTTGVVGEGEFAFPWLLERDRRGGRYGTTRSFTCEPVNGGMLRLGERTHQAARSGGRARARSLRRAPLLRARRAV